MLRFKNSRRPPVGFHLQASVDHYMLSRQKQHLKETRQQYHRLQSCNHHIKMIRHSGGLRPRHQTITQRLRTLLSVETIHHQGALPLYRRSIICLLHGYNKTASVNSLRNRHHRYHHKPHFLALEGLPRRRAIARDAGSSLWESLSAQQTAG